MINILSIRDRLNALPFVHGQRRVLIGQISDESGNLEFVGDDAASDRAREIEGDAIAEYLRNMESELRKNHLDLVRGEEDPNSIYAVQQLRRESQQDMRWMSEAMNWVTRITTVGLEMVVPGLIGLWLDQKLHTQFIGVLGFVSGVALGVWHLIQMARGQGSAKL